MSTLIKTPSWNDVIFGIRFREQSDPDFRPFFVPLRKVDLIASERQDELNISFRLGDFIEPVMYNKGPQKRLPRLDLTPLVANVSEAKLFLQLTEFQLQETKAWHFKSTFPQDFWDAFVNSLSAVARQKLRDATILRLDGLGIRGQNARLAPVEIDRQRLTWGYSLRQDTTYDVYLYWKRLVEKGIAAPPATHVFTLTNPAEELQASRRTIRMAGNYRSEEIWIQPSMGKPGPIDLAFEPAKIDEPMQVVDQASSKTIGLKIPILTKARLLTVPAVVNFVLSILSIMGIAWSLRVYFYGSPSDATKRILELFIAALASVAVTSLKDLFIGKSE